MRQTSRGVACSRVRGERARLGGAVAAAVAFALWPASGGAGPTNVGSSAAPAGAPESGPGAGADASAPSSCRRGGVDAAERSPAPRAAPALTSDAPRTSAAALSLPYVARHGYSVSADVTVRQVARRTAALAGGSMDEWDWEAGVALVGLMRYHQATGDPAAVARVREWVSARLAEGVPVLDSSWRTPDCSAGAWPAERVLHPNHAAPGWAVALLAEAEPSPAYDRIVAATAGYLLHDACRAGGSLAHQPDELWDDTLAMAVPLLLAHARATDDELVFDLAAQEYIAHARYLQRGYGLPAGEGAGRRNGLWFHGWSFSSRDHMSGAHWARGNGWVALAGAELLAGMPQGHPRRPTIARLHAAQLEALAATQAADGLWHTVVDRPDFYLETSGSAAIAAALLASSDPVLRDHGHAARAAVFRAVAGDGTLTGVSAGTGVAPSVDVYNRVPTTGIRPYGQGLFLIMATAGGS